MKITLSELQRECRLDFVKAERVLKFLEEKLQANRAETLVSQTSELTCEQKLNDLANELSKEVIDKYKFINENKEPLIEGVLDEAEIEWFLYFKEKIKSFCEQP